MGSPPEEAGRASDEGPVHRVRITRPFYLGVHEVTLSEFRAFVEDTGYVTDAERDGRGGWGHTGRDEKLFRRDPAYTWRNTGFEQGDKSPVVNVSWNDAVAFCRWVEEKEGATCRLPTEAEWEYACRAGTQTRFSHGDDDEGLARTGNVADAVARRRFAGWMRVNAVDRRKIGTAAHEDGHVFTAPAGRFAPNPFGLHDMHGNVWEWCRDRDARDYYERSPVDDPQGPETGESRIRRGGSWLHSPRYARSARRRRYAPEARNSPIGFRVVSIPAG